jgi:hypothetical protein
MKKCPCTKDCPERSATCHATCQRHKEWETQHREQLKAINKRKAADSGIVDYFICLSDKSRKRHK